MKVIPAALLTLLSAASSILPSAAAEKESISGVARKLSGKAEKGDELGGTDPHRRMIGDLNNGLRAYAVARALFNIIDEDGSGSIDETESVKAAGLFGDELVNFAFGDNLCAPENYTVNDMAGFIVTWSGSDRGGDGWFFTILEVLKYVDP